MQKKTIRNLRINEAQESVLVEMIQYFNDCGWINEETSRDYDVLADLICDPGFWEYELSYSFFIIHFYYEDSFIMTDAVTRIREDLQQQLISQIWEDEYLIGNVIEDYVKGLDDSDLEDLRKFVNDEEDD